MGQTRKTPTVDWKARLTSLGSQTFYELFPAQEAALNTYSENQDGLPNVAIELPTGAGKTLIALLILDFWKSQGRRTVVLCGTKNLARQFKNEADLLGLDTVLFEGTKTQWKAADKFRYHRGQAVAILNYWGYINQSPGLDSADVIVFDDAHLAENAAHSLFSLEIHKGIHDLLYKELISELATRFPHYTTLQDYELGTLTPFSPVELLNFTDWLEFLPRFETILTSAPECKPGGSLWFEWARAKKSLCSSLCLVSGNSISVRPGTFPTINESHIKKPQQRIFLSATIGTADDLARRVGIPNIVTLPIESKFRLAVPGKRLLLFPESESRESDLVTLAFDAAVRLRRSVWLCASLPEAAIWERRLQEVLLSKGITDQPVFVAKGEAEEIDHFIEAKSGHLFTAARYDGMDFEGDICRLVVVPSLPQACGPYERFISENLADASFMCSRVLQRMKQALGRATRNDHDWSVYVFLKNSLTHYLTSAEAFDHFPSNVQDEIGFGVDLSTKTADEISKIMGGFLRGKLAEIQFPQKAVRFPSNDVTSASDVANEEVQFWENAFALLSFDKASRSAERVASKLETANQPGYGLFWRYLRAQALYLRYVVDNDLLGLSAAKTELAKVLDEPRQSAWFSRLNRLRNSLNLEIVQDAADVDEHDVIVASWNQLLTNELRNPAIHEKWMDEMRSGLGGSHHGRFCVSVKRLLNLSGWDAEIRDKTEGDTDIYATISVSGAHYLLVIEGKPEMEGSKAVPLRYVAQTLGQLQRYQNDSSLRLYSKGAILVSKSTTIEESALGPAKSITFLSQDSLLRHANQASAAFQRYASIRFKRGFLPKRSECVEALEMAPRALGIFHITEIKGKVLQENEFADAILRIKKNS